jgi:hypothetical protein
MMTQKEPGAEGRSRKFKKRHDWSEKQSTFKMYVCLSNSPLNSKYIGEGDF